MRSFQARGHGISLHVTEWEAVPLPLPVSLPPLPIVLLHGFMDAGGTWDLVAPALAAAGHRVLAPDHRGFGKSDRVPVGGYYHFPDYVADLDPLVSDHVEGRFVLVGHSMGGTIATLFAGARADRVAQLVLLEGLGPPDHPFDAAPVRLRHWLDQLARQSDRPAKPMTLEAALDKLAANHPRVPREVLRSRLPNLVRPIDGGFDWSFDPLHRTTSPMPFFAAAFREHAKKVTAPVLYVSGGKLGFRTPDEVERLGAFANVRHEDLEGAGHMMHWTRPDDVARLVLEAAAACTSST